MNTLLRILLVLVPSLVPSTLYAQALYNGHTYNAPVCNNPNCVMCNYIRAQLQSQSTPQSSFASSDVYSPSTSSTTKYKQVPYTVKVKRCNGITCWYENVTMYRTVDISHSNPAGPEDYWPGWPFTHDTPKKSDNTLAITKLDPTPLDAVVEMLALASPKEDQVLYDLGCGDGRVLVAATGAYNCRSVGIELNPDSLEQAKVNTISFRDKIRLYLGNILDYSYPEADIVTMYLYPDLMRKVLPKLKSGTKVISYLHEIPGSKKVQIREHIFYVWTKP